MICCALDHGITHFDTSPYYGYGLGERALSKLCKDNVTIATKFGLTSKGGSDQSLPEVILRKGFGKLCAKFNRIERNFTIKAAQDSLEGSLRRLRRDYIDYFLIHEPIGALMCEHELCDWLEDLQARGYIRNYGIAGSLELLHSNVSKKSNLWRTVQSDIAAEDLVSLRRLKPEYVFSFGWRRSLGRNELSVCVNAANSKSEGGIDCHLFGTLKEATIKRYALYD